MIKTLTIENFKSIKKMEMDCRRINLFIGEPNTGKSNILEAFGLVSFCCNSISSSKLKDYIRFEHIQYLYYDSIVDKPIKIGLTGQNTLLIQMSYDKDNFYIHYNDEKEPLMELDYNGEPCSRKNKIGSIFFYRFTGLEKIDNPQIEPLLAPNGKNLFMAAYSSKENREMISNLFKQYGLKAVFKPHEKKIELQKQEENIAVSYPLMMMSDTMQRIIFYLLAIRTNKDAVLVFEEPESHAFPYYTKHLGEIIAADKSNQYFIATHNPYLLYAIIEKADKNDVNVCVTYYRDYQTKVKKLGPREIELLLDQDPFLSLDHFIGD